MSSEWAGMAWDELSPPLEIPTAIDLGTMQDAEDYGQHSIANVTEMLCLTDDEPFRVVPKGISVRYVQGKLGIGAMIYECGKHRCLVHDENSSLEAKRICGGTRPHMIWHGDEFGYILCATG
jgi:hypothetical protein